MISSFGIVGGAGATSYTDIYNANHLFMSAWGTEGSVRSTSWEFNITDPSSGSFDPLLQDVTSATVKLNLEDEKDCFGWWEVARLNVGDNNFWWEVDTGDISFSVASIMHLSDSGRVDAKLTASWGDFYFNSAILTAEGTDPSGESPISVPEPATSFFIGLGLLGVAAYRRTKMA